MALLADRVRETTTTAGTGTLTLDGAPSGFRTFTTAFGNGVSVYYVIAGPSEWEIGIGTTGAGTLSRDTVLVSSAGGTTKVTFAAGTKDVFCSYVAPRAVTTEDAATLTNKTIDSITNLVGADHIHYKIKANATIAKGQALKVVGYNVGALAIEVEPVSSASDVAVGIAYQALNTGDFGAAINTGLLTGTKTDYAGWALGDILYPDPSTGGLTKTKPSSGTYQACAYVMRVNSNNGVLLCEFTEPEPVAASANTANTVVARDGSGNFSAGTITAALTGNASTASALTPGATINGVTFTGASNITVAAAAGTLTGNTLASGVTASSLTSVGTLTSLTVSGNLTVDTSTLAVDAANNRVGILNASPGSTFHVGSTVASGGLADSLFTVNITGASNPLVGIQDAVVQGYIQAAGTVPEMRVGTYTAHDLAFYTSNISRAKFTAAGAFLPSSNTNIVLSGTGKFGTDGITPAYSFHAGTTAVPVTLTQQAVFSNSTQGGMSVTDGTRQLTMWASAANGCALATVTVHDLRFLTSNTNRWDIGASTGHLLAATDNTYDIGASGATRPRDLFLGRNATVAGNIENAGHIRTTFSSVNGFSQGNRVTNTQPNANHYLWWSVMGTGGEGVAGWASSVVLEANTYNAASGDKSFVFSNYANTSATYNFVWQIGNRNPVWAITGTGHLVCPTDNTYDIGANGATRPRDLYIGRNADHGGWMRAGAASAGAASTTTIGNGTATTVGASGAASALPANPLGYIVAHVGTTQVKIPYYTA